MHLLVNLSLPITDPVLIFALVLFIILIIPLAFARIKVPGLVGLIIAGVLIGPNALNLLARDATIVLLGTVGLLYIMFVAGLEIDLNRFNKYKSHSVVFGAFTFFIPQVGGTLMAVYLLGFSWPAAILLASMFASHTLVAYPIASRLGITKNSAVTATIGGTIITDTAALLVLAIILAAEGGELDASFWVILTVSLALYTVVVFWGLPRVGRWFFRNVDSEGSAEFLFVLAAVFASAFLSDLAGVEPIIGAFMAGLALNRLIPEQGPLMNRIQFVGNALFIPFFLISVGMLVDVRILFAGADAWIIAIAMVVTTIVGKWLAAYGSRRLLGYTKAEGGVMFALSVAQAAATLAVVLIAFEVGIFGALGVAVLNGSIMMILVTCIIAPIFAEKYGRQVALEEEKRPYRISDAPQRILVPLANPTTAADLMNVAFTVHTRDSREPIYPLTVARDAENVQALVAASEKVLSHAVLHAAAADFPVVPLTRIDMNIASGIVRAIRENRISNVIIGWTGQVSAQERIFGTVLDQLLHQAREMLMVCRFGHPLNTTQRVLAIVPPFADRESGFAEAMKSIRNMTDQLGASLRILSTVETVDGLKPMLAKMRPEVPTEFVPVKAFSRSLGALRDEYKAGDLVVLFSVREGTIAWRPGLDRLPRLIAQRFSGATLVVVYAAELVPEETGFFPRAPHLQLISRMISRGLVQWNLEGIPQEEILPHLVTKVMNGSPRATEAVIRQLLGDDADYLPEVSAGVVLYHAHTAEVTEQVLCMGISRDGVLLPRAGSKAHVIFVLINPISISPEEHLKSLAAIAHVLHSSEIVEGLRNVQNLEGVRHLLTGDGFRPAPP